MQQKRIKGVFASLLDMAVMLCRESKADALLLLLDGISNWDDLMSRCEEVPLLVAADKKEQVAGAAEANVKTVLLDMSTSPVFEKLTQALIEAVADDLLPPGGSVVALYSGFEAGNIDSISHIRLHEHLRRLTVRDLQQLETKVPLDTLKVVLDLAVEIGREGREGKPVGTMFVVGDARKVMNSSAPMAFDMVRGYKRSERNLNDPRVRESVKEVAQLDGAFIVNADGTVEASCRHIDAPSANLTLSKGLGARHWAAAAITRNTNAIAIVVSESNGTVRLFQNGEIMLRIEPFRRAMKWKEFDYEPPAASEPD